MDRRVVLEAAVPVYDVETADEAVRIAISKTGAMLNPDLNYVEIDPGERACPDCGVPQQSAFIAADEGLVALELAMTVFNVEDDEHAARIARKEIGQCLDDVPLELVAVESADDDGSATGDASDDGSSDTPNSGDTRADDGSGADSPDPSDDTTDDVLPEFEELIDE